MWCLHATMKIGILWWFPWAWNFLDRWKWKFLLYGSKPLFLSPTHTHTHTYNPYTQRLLYIIRIQCNHSLWNHFINVCLYWDVGLCITTISTNGYELQTPVEYCTRMHICACQCNGVHVQRKRKDSSSMWEIERLKKRETQKESSPIPFCFLLISTAPIPLRTFYFPIIFYVYPNFHFMEYRSMHCIILYSVWLQYSGMK